MKEMSVESNLEATARSLAAPGKGILAADESTGTIEKRLKSINVPCTEENRRDYRSLLFSTEGLGEFISGVILYDETLRQKSADGTTMVELLKRQDIIPGIKVDKGAKPLAGFPGDKITEGLDGLRDRLKEYAQLGARFTKWRAVIKITPETPSRLALKANVHALARFAGLSQEAGLVPIVEPEVLMDGGHTIERHYEVTRAALHHLFHQLREFRVHLPGILLKPNMVLSGSEAPEQASIDQAARMTLNVLLETVPAAVPGVVFLSGGQSAVRATEHLNAINQLGRAPWALSFSFGRALQEPALSAWGGQAANVLKAQKALLQRSQCNSSARFGKYSSKMEG